MPYFGHIKESMTFKSDLYSSILADNLSALTVRAESVMLAQANGRALVATDSLDLSLFEQRGHCRVYVESEPRPVKTLDWGGEDDDRLNPSFDQVVYRVEWQGNTVHVVHLEWATSCGERSREWVVADTEALAEAFLLDVSRKTHHPGNAILVFAHGYWQRSESLYWATQSASLDDLILADDLKQTIRDDFARFLESEDRYQRLGISWRRGAILIGPPGNGKTHFVRAIVKELSVPCLYVQSVRHEHFTPEQMWKRVFDRARRLRPCVLILEDLDSLVSPKDRSFFLNQLDGFHQNHGLIVLATTNHPDRIDAAIMDRPSRFDRKYHFLLPRPSEREAYLRLWQAKLSNETSWLEGELARAVVATEGFSFAYLKELVISSLMAWMHVTERPFIEVLEEQANVLGGQMQTEQNDDNASSD